MKTYRDTLAELYRRAGKDARFVIERVEDAARGLGSPQDDIRAAHIAGSNGKGSVTSMLAAYLHRAGLRTGMFTSPHLHRYTERMRIDGREIPRRDVVRLFADVDRHVIRGTIPWLTFFELTTLIAFKWFAEREVDMAVVEVGMGGRLDATNVLAPEVAAITSISLEHLRILGPTLSAIAREKAGILKPGVPVVLGTLPDAARRVIERRARRLRCPVWKPGRDYRITVPGPGRFDYEGPGATLRDLRLRLAGAHQSRNAGVAVALADLLSTRGIALDEDALRAALRSVRWPGRLETVARGPETIMDCAHNPDGLRSLVRSLKGRRFHLVFGGMADKPTAKMLRILEPVTGRLYLTAPEVPRALKPTDYPKSVRATRIRGVGRAVDRARADARKKGAPVLVTGSIFTVSEARSHVLGLKRLDPIITM
jgi:dihydrofolate synthase/folylpolyglutamate synthase